jgi:hypothetical protein
MMVVTQLWQLPNHWVQRPSYPAFLDAWRQLQPAMSSPPILSASASCRKFATMPSASHVVRLALSAFSMEQVLQFAGIQEP